MRSSGQKGSLRVEGIQEVAQRAVAAPYSVFFHSGERLVYYAAVTPRLSVGLICHPIKKNRTALVQMEWESVSLLCSSKDGKNERVTRLRNQVFERKKGNVLFVKERDRNLTFVCGNVCLIVG